MCCQYYKQTQLEVMTSEKAAAEFQLEKEMKRIKEAQVCYCFYLLCICINVNVSIWVGPADWVQVKVGPCWPVINALILTNKEILLPSQSKFLN